MRASLLVLAVLAAGCMGGDRTPVGGEGAPVSHGANGDCVRAWNADGNAANRSATFAAHTGWAVSVSAFHISHPATRLSGEGCSYFFHSPRRWESYSGSWEADGDLRWGTPSGTSGRRTPAQKLQPPNAILRAQGRLARLSDDARPVGSREWRAVIDDWYDNGEIEQVHRCGAVREAVKRLPTSPPRYSSVFDDLRRYALLVC